MAETLAVNISRGDTRLGPIFLARLGGEAACQVGGFATQYLLTHPLQRPYHAGRDWLAEHFILPHLSQVEGFLDHYLPAVEPDSSRAKRSSKTPQERACDIADMMMTLSATFLGGVAAQIFGQQKLDAHFNIAQISIAEQGKVALFDRGSQVAMVALMNTGLAQQNKDTQKHLAPMLQKLLQRLGVDVDDEKAQTLASETVNLQSANLAGFTAGLLAHARYAKGA